MDGKFNLFFTNVHFLKSIQELAAANQTSKLPGYPKFTLITCCLLVAAYQVNTF